MANPYANVSFWNPQDQQQYNQLNNTAATMQQASMTPQIDPNGQASWTQGMGQLAQALVAARARHQANQLLQQNTPKQWAGPDTSMIGNG